MSHPDVPIFFSRLIDYLQKHGWLGWLGWVGWVVGGWLGGWGVGWVVGWLIGWPVGWLVGQSVGWLADDSWPSFRSNICSNTLTLVLLWLAFAARALILLCFSSGRGGHFPQGRVCCPHQDSATEVRGCQGRGRPGEDGRPPARRVRLVAHVRLHLSLSCCCCCC